MFSLNHQTAKLASVNPRAEIHGEDRVPAVDLKFEITGSNNVLSEFHPSLKSMLYERPSEPDLADDGTSLTQLRFKLLGPLKWAAELAGYTLRVHWGVSGHDDIALADCEVDTFRFDCEDGGSVGVGFRVIAHPTERDMGRLCGLIQREIEMSLEEPDAAPLFEDTKATKVTTSDGVKYRDPATGMTWTGRGKRPKWIENAMVDGSHLDEFLASNQGDADRAPAAA